MGVIGKIIEPPQANIRQHEMESARALANAGMTVEFILASTRDFTKSPDILISGSRWEIKSPITNKLTQIEKNLKRANRQSSHIIIDSQRVKSLPDWKIQSFLIKRLQLQPSIKNLLFINRRREIVDITKLL